MPSILQPSCLLLVITFAASASAAPITFSYTADVSGFGDTTGNGFLTGVSVGSPIRGHFTYDPAVADDFPCCPGVGNYVMQLPARYGFSAAVGDNFVVSLDSVNHPLTSMPVLVLDAPPGRFADQLQVRVDNVAPSTDFSSGSALLRLIDSDGTAWDSDALPTALPAPIAFDTLNEILFAATTESGAEVGVVGHPTSFQPWEDPREILRRALNQMQSSISALIANGSTHMVAEFRPTLSNGGAGALQQLANALGFVDFRWFQRVINDPFPPGGVDAGPLTAPYVDSPRGGFVFPSRFSSRDDAPWYWDGDRSTTLAGFSTPTGQRIRTHDRLVFFDQPANPGLSRSDGLYLGFETHLVGIEPVGRSSFSVNDFNALATNSNFASYGFKSIASFTWKSDLVRDAVTGQPESGDVFRSTFGDPVLSGPGGVFDVKFGKGFSSTANNNPVPEPSSFVLFLLGILLVGVYEIRKLGCNLPPRKRSRARQQ